MRLALFVALQCVLAACAGTDADRCEIDDDCPSGFCRADHTCAPASDGGETPDADLTIEDGTPGGCTPDHDGTIARDELPLVPGRTATYRVALDATIDTAGVMGANGMRTWTLADALGGDVDADAALVAPAGTWWEDSFPSASYATALSAESELLGVFELTDTKLRLLGVVSPTAGSGRTELVYDPPVDVLALPLAPTSAWMVDTTITGLAQGVSSFYTESYDYRVDALGTMDTPYGDFPVSRVAVDLSRNVGGFITTRRSFAFVAECYATVATIVSQDYEAQTEFTDAAEVRRLAP